MLYSHARLILQRVDMELLPYKAVAERLHIHPATVSRLVRAGKLPVVRIGKNTPRISAEALDAFLRSVAG